MNRLTMNIGKSESLFARAQKVSPGGVHSPVRAFRGVGGVPRFIQSAQGVYLEDVDGNRYIDFCMSWGPLVFGHQDPEIKEAALLACNQGFSFGTAEPYSLELAEFICDRIPWVEKIRFVNSGTEAVMSVLRVARAATGRRKFVKFDGCYHGHFDGLLMRAGSGLAEQAQPDSAGIPTSLASDVFVVPLDNPTALEQVFHLHGKEIAAVIIEPLPANYGLLPQKESFLKSIFNLAHASGALVIFDEVITGFRVAFGGMAEILHLKPDLVTYGKVLGGGFPVGAYAGRSDLMDLVAPQGNVYQAGTLSANPVAMRVGLQMLKKLDREKPYAQLEAKINLFKDSIVGATLAGASATNKTAGLPIHVQQVGSIFWLVFGAEGADASAASVPTAGIPAVGVRAIDQIPVVHRELFPKIFHCLLNKGVYLPPSAFEVCFLSTAHSLNHIEELSNALHQATKDLL